MPGLGFKSYIQLAPETTYGTAVAATSKLELIEATISPVIGVILDPSLYNKQSRRALYLGGLLFKGTIKVRLNFEGMLELLRGVTGTYTFPTVGGETVIRDHTFKEGATLKTYTIELIEGDVATGKCQRLVGATLTDLQLAWTAGVGVDAMGVATFTVVAKDKVSGVTPTAALNFPAIFPVLFHQAITTDDGITIDATNRLRSFEVMLSNPHDEARFYLGAVNIDQPVRNDFIKPTMKFTQEFQTAGQFDAARAFTAVSPQVVFQHPTTIGVASKREFEVRMNSAQVTSFSVPVTGYGVLISTCEIEGFQDPTDASAMVIRVRSGDAGLP
jgi:hypothetical protein